MTVEQQNRPTVTPSRLLNPWIVAAAALVVYTITLNHWVTLRGLPWIAPTAGWDWHPISLEWRPAYFTPLWYLVTVPFRVLPSSWQPVALNFFSAICASLTLALLAASVHLLPQDRTREQRIREQGEFSLFSGRWAFLPQLFAILVVGLQGVFWSNATAASDEMLDVLVFAFLIYALLRFRISQNERWLHALALVYGVGVTNNFALIGFFPFFLVALIWIKGLSFFNLRFIFRILGIGLVGLTLYLLEPLLGSIGSQADSFGPILLRELKQQSFLLRMVPGWIALVASLSTLAPLLCAGLRWPEIEGETSAVGNALTRLTFMTMNVLLLPVVLLLFFDWRIGTNPHMHDAPTPFLTFYYLGGLAVGYYSGYILVVFGKRAVQRAKFKSWPALNKSVVAILWILLIAAPLGLLYQSFGLIRSTNNGILRRFTAETIAALPAKTSIVLSDDPIRLQLLDAAYRKSGEVNPHIMLETGSLPYKEYFAYLIDRYPQLKKQMIPMDKFPPKLSEMNILDFLYQLGHQYAIYYLHPSFGFYFEQFYLRPHRLVYEFKPYTTPTYLPPPPGEAEIKDNQEFWKAVKQASLDRLPQLVADNDWDAARVSVDYSVALDFWGVELQRANHLADAHAAFANAYFVNTNNLMAKYNLEYNQQLQTGDRRPLEENDTMARALSLYGSVPAIIKFNGPPDEPGVDLAFGQMLAQGGNLRQAAALFERRLQLLPNDVPAKMAVAKTFVDTGHADRALELTREIRAQTNSLPDELFWVEAVAYLAHTNFAEAERTLLQGEQQEPQNTVRLANTMEFYRRTAISSARQGRPAEAVARRQKALACASKFIDLITTDKSNAGKFSLADVLLIKAEIEVGLESWDAAIQTLDRILDLDSDNTTALINRAKILIRLKKYAAAKDDAEAVRKLMPKQAFAAYALLADIAQGEQDPAAEKKYLRLYLKAISPASPQYAATKSALDKLEAR